LPVGGVEEAHGGIGSAVITVTQSQLTSCVLTRRTETHPTKGCMTRIDLTRRLV
jgi:ribosomal protein L25 (general stress protein Ctc)